MFCLKGFLLVLVLGWAAAGKCPSGQKKVKLVKGEEAFDVTFGVKSAQEALKGGKGMKVNNGDVLAIDANTKYFSVSKICIKTKSATEVKFQFFGDDLQLIKEYKVDVENKKTFVKTCVKPDLSGVWAVWVFSKNLEEQFSFPIGVKAVFMNTCLVKK